jgi:hypothetical protein
MVAILAATMTASIATAQDDTNLFTTASPDGGQLGLDEEHRVAPGL